jgi:predicted GNAT family N-acyltransferase
MKVVKFKTDNKELFEKARQIRNEVFIKEQNVPAEIEYEFEDESTHYLLLEKNQAMATARYRKTEQGFKLERFAVLKNARGKNYGSIILRHILKDLFGEKYIYLNAQKQVIKFYANHGFETEGDIFFEANIPHKKMVYKAKNPKDLAREKGGACKTGY